MSTINVSDDKIRGEGNKLYVIVTVDSEDAEDTITEFWRANDEDHLFDQVKESFVGDNDDDDDDEEVSTIGRNYAEMFEDDWGISILPTFVGEFV